MREPGAQGRPHVPADGPVRASADDLERDPKRTALLGDERVHGDAVDARLDRPDRLVASQAERHELLDLVLLDSDDLVARDGRTSGFRASSRSDAWTGRRLGFVTEDSQTVGAAFRFG